MVRTEGRGDGGDARDGSKPRLLPCDGIPLLRTRRHRIPSLASLELSYLDPSPLTADTSLSTTTSLAHLAVTARPHEPFNQSRLSHAFTLHLRLPFQDYRLHILEQQQGKPTCLRLYIERLHSHIEHRFIVCFAHQRNRHLSSATLLLPWLSLCNCSRRKHQIGSPVYQPQRSHKQHSIPSSATRPLTTVPFSATSRRKDLASDRTSGRPPVRPDFGTAF